MKRVTTTLILLLVLGASGRGTAAADAVKAAGDAGPTSPTAFLQAHDARVRAVVLASKGDTLTAAERDQVQTLISDAFDFRELARLSLGDAWDERTEAERDEFVDVYQQIVEDNNFDIFVRYHREGNVTYTGEETDDDGRAVVRAEVPVKKETKEITYALHRLRPDGPWRIYDITVDGAGTVEANRRAWGRYLARHSYAELLAQLRKKLDRLASAG